MENFAIALTLVISVITDLRSRKILNIITFPSMVLAFIYHTFTSGFDGFIFSGLGFLVGLSLLLIPFLMGGMGAGDVKLLAAIGAWKGVSFICYTGIFAALIGGLLSIIILIKQKKLRLTFKQMFVSFLVFKSTKGSLEVSEMNGSSLSIPFAVPIALGAVASLLMEMFV